YRDWVRPDFITIRRGVFADGLGTVLAALIGSVGGNTYSTGVGLSSAAQITSRHIDAGRRLAYGDLLPSLPKVGAVCGKAARPDLSGGREATRVPTATGASSSRFSAARRRGRWWRGRNSLAMSREFDKNMHKLVLKAWLNF
ncbi:MAG TPA: solute carrier family 23 protein, partial [Steroidobacteraceae bacterium]|nr:solute carrier family 23 protein [Steroidobacteraceae bacterium]